MYILSKLLVVGLVLAMGMALPTGQVPGLRAQPTQTPGFLLDKSREESPLLIGFGTDRTTYYMGTEAKAQFKVFRQKGGQEVPEAVYVYFIDFNEDGRPTLLLPKADKPLENFFRFQQKGGNVALEEFLWTVSQLKGLRYLQILVTRFPISLTPDKLNQPEEIKKEIHNSGMTDADWSASFTSYRVTEQRLEGGAERGTVLFDVTELPPDSSGPGRVPVSCDSDHAKRPLVPMGVEIFLEDKDKKVEGPFTPFTMISLPPGGYQVTIKHQEFVDTTGTVELKANQTNRVCATLKRIKDKIHFVTGVKEPDGTVTLTREFSSGKTVVFDACRFLSESTRSRVQEYKWDFGGYADRPKDFGNEMCEASATYRLPESFEGDNAKVPVKLTIDFKQDVRCGDYGADPPPGISSQGNARSCSKTITITILRPSPLRQPKTISCNDQFGPSTLKVEQEGASSASFIVSCLIPAGAKQEVLTLHTSYSYKALPDKALFEEDWFRGASAIEVSLQLPGDPPQPIGVAHFCTLNNYDNRCQARSIFPEQQQGEVDIKLLDNPLVRAAIEGLARTGGGTLEVVIRLRLEVLLNREKGDGRFGKPVEVEYSGKLESK
jgi:hypothetical protein